MSLEVGKTLSENSLRSAVEAVEWVSSMLQTEMQGASIHSVVISCVVRDPLSPQRRVTYTATIRGVIESHSDPKELL
jgi:hypothetical protein